MFTSALIYLFKQKKSCGIQKHGRFTEEVALLLTLALLPIKGSVWLPEQPDALTVLVARLVHTGLTWRRRVNVTLFRWVTLDPRGWAPDTRRLAGDHRSGAGGHSRWAADSLKEKGNRKWINCKFTGICTEPEVGLPELHKTQWVEYTWLAEADRKPKTKINFFYFANF